MRASITRAQHDVPWLPGLWARWTGSGQLRVWVVGRKLLRGLVLDEALGDKPLGGPAVSANDTEGVPRGNQFGVALVDLVFEAGEGSPPVQGLRVVLPRLTHGTTTGSQGTATGTSALLLLQVRALVGVEVELGGHASRMPFHGRGAQMQLRAESRVGQALCHQCRHFSLTSSVSRTTSPPPAEARTHP